MSYTALNGGAAFVTGQPWAYQDANDARLDLADHETRLLAEEAATAAAILSQAITTANGASWTRAATSEEITLSTVGLTTDSVANLLPANSIIEAVVARITTTITTTTNWKMGDGTIAGRFTAANATLTAGTTDIGLVHIDQTGTSGPRQTAAAKLRITCTGANPGAGKVRVTVFYRVFVAPTS